MKLCELLYHDLLWCDTLSRIRLRAGWAVCATQPPMTPSRLKVCNNRAHKSDMPCQRGQTTVWRFTTLTPGRDWTTHVTVNNGPGVRGYGFPHSLLSILRFLGCPAMLNTHTNAVQYPRRSRLGPQDVSLRYKASSHPE